MCVRVVPAAAAARLAQPVDTYVEIYVSINVCYINAYINVCACVACGGGALGDEAGEDVDRLHRVLVCVCVCVCVCARARV